MQYQLRDYQQDAVNQIRAYYKQGAKSVMYVGPCRTGKTVIFSYIAESAQRKQKRILIQCHRRELIQQASRKLSEAGVPHGIIAPGFPMTNHLVQVGSVQTIVRRLGVLPAFDLIITDECHHAVASSWRKIIEHFPDALGLGVTASPLRLDGMGLGVEVGGLFDAMVVGPSVQAMTNQGWLTPCDTYSPPNEARIDKLHTLAGDYKKDEMEAEMDRPVITGNAVSHYRRLCPGSPAIAFCVSVQHAKNVAEEFRRAGFMFVHVDGNMKEEDRDIAMNGLRDGKIQGVCSCEIISEGVDVPRVTAGILLRPTQSLGMHIQQSCRILTPCKGKARAILLDHVGNCIRHGLPHEDRIWDLNATKEDRRKKSDAPPVRQCPKCFYCHRPAPVCPHCQYVYPVEAREVEQVDGDLRILTPEEFRKRRTKMKARSLQGQCKELADLIKLAMKRGYKNPAGWAKYVYYARQRNKETFKAGEQQYAF